MVVDVKPEDVRVEVLFQQMGGFAPIKSNGIKITHIPTGIVVKSESGRSQHANRELAFQDLKELLSGRPVTSRRDQLVARLRWHGTNVMDSDMCKEAADMIEEDSEEYKRVKRLWQEDYNLLDEMCRQLLSLECAAKKASVALDDAIGVLQATSYLQTSVIVEQTCADALQSLKDVGIE